MAFSLVDNAFVPVQTRIEIDFPVVDCILNEPPDYKTEKDCILLDPVVAMANLIYSRQPRDRSAK